MQSMTGYAECTFEYENQPHSIRIRSVNQRLLDVRFLCPKSYLYLEDLVRNRMKEVFFRGKLDVLLDVSEGALLPNRLFVDIPLARSYMQAFSRIANEFQIPNENPDARYLASLPEVLRFESQDFNRDAYTKCFQRELDNVIEELSAVRTREGEVLALTMIEQVSRMRNFVQIVVPLVPKLIEAYEKRIESRLTQRGLMDIDKQRIAQEIVLFADRCDISEEITRVNAHLDNLDKVLHAVDRPCGKRIDFILQELLREVNTMGAKSLNPDITDAVVEMKLEIEKLREQTQNIE